MELTYNNIAVYMLPYEMAIEALNEVSLSDPNYMRMALQLIEQHKRITLPIVEDIIEYRKQKA